LLGIFNIFKEDFLLKIQRKSECEFIDYIKKKEYDIHNSDYKGVCSYIIKSEKSNRISDRVLERGY